jgi:hypothetical protein
MSKSAGPTDFIEFRPGMRRLIEDAIEILILLLDEIDGDDDLEMTACECQGSDWSCGHDIPDDSEESWDQEYDLADLTDDDRFDEADVQPVHLPGGGGLALTGMPSRS